LSPKQASHFGALVVVSQLYLVWGHQSVPTFEEPKVGANGAQLFIRNQIAPFTAISWVQNSNFVPRWELAPPCSYRLKHGAAPRASGPVAKRMFWLFDLFFVDPRRVFDEDSESAIKNGTFVVLG
jgi:hypothetical protein